MKFKQANTHTIQCMGQDISLKGKTHDLNHDLTFSAHTINCVCHSIRSMFRVLGIHNFDPGPAQYIVLADIIEYLWQKLLVRTKKYCQHTHTHSSSKNPTKHTGSRRDNELYNTIHKQWDQTLFEVESEFLLFSKKIISNFDMSNAKARIIHRTYLQLPLRQWGAGNVYILVLFS